MIIGNVPINGYYTKDGKRYRRNSLTTSRRLSKKGYLKGQAFSHDPLEEVELDNGLPIEGQWVRWKDDVCPYCGDWLFCDGKILKCNCGRTFEVHFAAEVIDE